MTLDRRANPPGWTQPKLPYNPYDYTDVRPPQGYPSEFKTPGREPTLFTEIPRDLSEYQVLRNSMKRLSYTPRPMSEIYPGQYKVLRRIHTQAGFENGVKITSKVLVFGLLTYIVFFNRWNDGYENIFSKFYRFQLEMRSQFFDLDQKQKQDLQQIRQPKYTKFVPENEKSLNDDLLKDIELNDVALQRPTKKQFLELERISQDRELNELRK